MALKDLIVPKWKHSRADVRLAAIETFCNDLNVIREIAEKDESSSVRIAAVKKIEDEQILSALLNSEKDQEVLDVAKKQLEVIFKKIISTSTDKDEVVRALEMYKNEKATAAYLCEHTCDLIIQQKLIKHIKSGQLLAKLTEHECASEIAETIVGQISEKEFLERIAQRASNKKVRTIAQERIDTLFADPTAKEREVTAKLRLCCSGMDIKVAPRNYDQALELLEISRNIWNKYDPQWQHPLVETYKTAEKNLQDRIARAQAQKTALDALEAICEKMELLTKERSDTLADQYEQLGKQWSAADRSVIQDVVTVSLDDRFTTACAKVRQIIKEILELREQNVRLKEALEQACIELEQCTEDTIVPDEKVWHRLVARWKEACSNLAPDESLLQRFTAAGKKYQDKIAALVQIEKNAMQDEIEHVEQLAAEMQSISQAGQQQIRSRYQQVVRIKQQWDKPWPLAKKRKTALQEEFTSAYDSFMDTYYELKEQSSWQQWASGNAKAKILEEVELLETQINQGESLRKISRKIGLFDSQWKQSSGFGKQGGTEVDERYSAVRDRILAAALAKKTELLETLKTVLAAPEQNNNADEIKAIQKQWNEIGYLPADMEKDLPETFYGLCNSYFEQRKEHYQKYTEESEKNCAIREEICTEAARLADSTDWKVARDVFAALQKRWDESWPAPHKKSQELWEQFSASRKAFFERYHAFQGENDKQKETLCGEAEQLLAKLTEWESVTHEEPAQILNDEAVSTDENGESVVVESEADGTEGVHTTDAGEAENTPALKVNFGSILSAAIKLQKVWKESGPASAERSDELWERFNGTLKKVFSIIDEEHRNNFELKETIVKEAEALAASEDWDDTSLRFQELRAQWKTIRPAAYRDDQALWKRLQAAGDTFFGRRKAHFDSLKSVAREKLEEKEALITELEIMVRIAGKSHLLKTSQNHSAAEVLKMGIDLRNQLIVDGDPEKTYNNIKKRAFEIIDIWESGEQLRGKEFYQLERRFDELLDILRRR
ncbi:MAG TPA: DUF349 domain-containing protein [Chitinispirillaceae bacterium]|nr:DUF349 domain-containing protein [Chitinispirillaceae bacterium]